MDRGLVNDEVDQLNANFMDDSFGFIQVISQGPTPAEMFYFWYKIIEFKIGVLVVNGEIFDGHIYDVKKIDAAFPIEANETFIFSNKTMGETIKVSTITKDDLLEGIITRSITVVKEGKDGKMAEITITALQWSEFSDKNYKLSVKDLHTLAMFVYKVFEDQLEQLAKGLPGVWIHCLDGLERSAIVATLHQSLQIIAKLGHVNVRPVMRYVRSNHPGAFSVIGADRFGVTTPDNFLHMFLLIEDRAIPLLVKWRKDRKTFDALCMEMATGKKMKLLYMVLGPKGDDESSFASLGKLIASLWKYAKSSATSKK